MANSRTPVIYEVDEDQNYFETISDDIKYAVLSKDGNQYKIIERPKSISKKVNPKSDLILKYPVVYMHVWQDKKAFNDNKFKIYIGEAEDAVRRQKDHYQDSKKKNS